MGETSVTADKSNRIEYLDSARGLAACSVMLFHTILMYNWKVSPLPTGVLPLLKIIFNGSDAVSFFFVLSGFVLTASIRKTQDNFNFPNYIVRRIFRIYPLYALVVIAAFLLDGKYKWFILLQELNLSAGVHQFVGPGWTMGIELFLSILVPVLVLVMRQRSWSMPLLIFSLLAYNFVSWFTFQFILGILIYDAYRSGRRIEWLAQARYRIPILLFCFLLYSLKYILPLVPRVQHLVDMGQDLIGMNHEVFCFDMSGIASAIFILTMLEWPALQTILNQSVLAFIGRISFSIYLLHWLVMNNVPVMQMQTVLPSGAPFLIVLILIVASITIALSYITYRFVELPFINMARKIDTGKWFATAADDQASIK